MMSGRQWVRKRRACKRVLAWPVTSGTSLIALLLLFSCFLAAPLAAETIEVLAIDDAEEREGAYNHFPVDERYIVHRNDDQLSAYRFDLYNIPAGSEITKAILVFSVAKSKDLVDEHRYRPDDTTRVKLYGELSIDPDSFDTMGTDISSRTPTQEYVVYDSGSDGNAQDMTAVVNEILAQPGLGSSQEIVLITEKLKIAKWDTELSVYSATQSPARLYITYQPPAPQIETTPTSLGPTCYVGTDAASTSFTLSEVGDEFDFTGEISVNIENTDSGIQWLTVTLPSGDLDANNPLPHGDSIDVRVDYTTQALPVGTYKATISISGNASNSPQTIFVTLIVKGIPESSACGEVPLYAENLVNPAIMVQLDTSGSMKTEMPILSSGDNPATPSLVTIVQEIIDQKNIDDPTDPLFPRAGWQAGQNMAFVISGEGQRRAWSYDGQQNGAPKLVATYSTGSGSEVEVVQRIAKSSGDVQVLGNTVKENEDYLALGREDEPVGLLFEEINIPAGATIESAEIQFVISTGDDGDTDLIIHGVALDSAGPFTEVDQFEKNLTTAKVEWNDVESWAETMTRIDIAEDVLKEIFLDRSIAWGFATWAGGSGDVDESQDDDYTTYRIGVHSHDDEHHEKLQEFADDGEHGGFTPLAPTLNAGFDYFTSDREDNYYGEVYPSIECQPRILIIITDGLGNTGTTMDLVRERTNALLAEDISVVAVGFGISDAEQIQEIAALAQEAGDDKDTDYLYGLHEVDADGVGIPFLAQSRQEFIEAMNTIVTNVKAQVFHGSTPAPTTSVNDGEVLLSSSFDASDWSGELTATEFDGYTGVLASEPLWTAKEKIPAAAYINGYIYDSTAAASGYVTQYTTASLAGDNYLCKSLGDIIGSTPKIVAAPPYFYNYDGYKSFKYNKEIYNRPSLVYVGANDGALHAFELATGSEKWRFYPEGVKAKLNLMTSDSKKDICSVSYCHDFILDGSPQAADIYTGSLWKTILLTGLGRGGKSFFNLDVTYGNDFVAATNPSNFLWEFSETDDSELGLATSIPEIERVGVFDNAGNETGSDWVAFFGSGPEQNDILQETKDAYLFAVGAYDKGKVWKSDAIDTANTTYKVKLPADASDNVPASPVTIDVAGDDHKVDHIYLGDLYGNMFRVHDIGNGQVPIVAKLFKSERTNHNAPITTKAGFAFAGDDDKDGIEDIWIYFGTGKYDEQVDKVSFSQQFYYGLQDPEASKATPYVQGDLATLNTGIYEAYALDDYGQRVDLNGDNKVDSNDLKKYRTLSCDVSLQDNEGNCSSGGTSWVLNLYTDGDAPSERVLNNSIIAGGIVFFLSFVPDDNVCEGNGDTWLFALDYQNGSGAKSVFDLNKDGKFTESDCQVENGGLKENTAGIYVGSGKPTGLALHNDILFVGTTGEPPKAIKVNIRGLRARLKAWRQQFN